VDAATSSFESMIAIYITLLGMSRANRKKSEVAGPAIRIRHLATKGPDSLSTARIASGPRRRLQFFTASKASTLTRVTFGSIGVHILACKGLKPAGARSAAPDRSPGGEWSHKPNPKEAAPRRSVAAKTQRPPPAPNPGRPPRGRPVGGRRAAGRAHAAPAIAPILSLRAIHV